jgi:hypothetical protein
MGFRLGWPLVALGSVVLASACGSDDDSGTPVDRSAGGQGGEVESPSAGAGTAGTPSETSVGGMGGAPAAVTPHGGAGAAPAAAGAGGEGGAVEPQSPDVHGVVRDFDSMPITIAVQVNGVSATVDEHGTFDVPAVADEYDLVMYLPDHKLVIIYDDLHTRNPQIDLGLGLSGDPAHGASVRGKVTGGLQAPFQVAADITVFTQVAYVSDVHGPLYPRSSIDPPEGYAVDPRWSGLATDSGEALALQYTFQDGVGTVEYTGFGRRPLSIEDGLIYGSLSGSPLTDIALTKPPQSQRSANLTVPSGWKIDSSALHIGPFADFGIAALGDFSMLVPQLEAVPQWVSLQLSGADGSSELHLPLSDADPWTMVSAPPPKPVVPADNAAAVNLNTQFTWSGLPEGTVAGVKWSVGDWSVEHYTTSTSLALPDLSAFGATLPTGEEGAWMVYAVGPTTTTDGVLSAWHEYYADEGKPMLIYQSSSRKFTHVD